MGGTKEALHCIKNAARHRLKREFGPIHMEKGEDPLDYFDRVGKAADELAMLECVTSDEEVNQHIIQNLSSLYTLQKSQFSPVLVSPVLKSTRLCVTRIS